MLLTHDAFFTQLTTLFALQKKRFKGSIFLSQKRYTYEQDQPMKNTETEADDAEYPCLLRAVYGNDKISTLVQPAEQEKFLIQYGNILKANMDSLKKKKRKKKTKVVKKVTTRQSN